ncbi:hypothetical protein L596_021315 [Steinernema carpocapsae]|uniref:Uncharacterized protein n=1 Tax=Steinernema carpocapsae TaxID=34508 RepID=A0A4U5MIB4_STECR|nr:hypothetical protein L596_021315 [Steinernema carpocapsae]
MHPKSKPNFVFPRLQASAVPDLFAHTNLTLKWARTARCEENRPYGNLNWPRQNSFMCNMVLERSYRKWTLKMLQKHQGWHRIMATLREKYG